MMRRAHPAIGVKTRIPPPIYALVTAGAMWVGARYAPVPAALVIETPWNHLGWGLLALGLGVEVHSVCSFIRARTTVNPMRIQLANRLVATGLYRISRNPMYLGLILSLSGWGVLLGHPLTLMLVWVFARLLVVVQIAPEEEALREKFGEAYLAYSRRVNRWIGRAKPGA